MNTYHKDNIVNEAMTSIELTLEREYKLNTKDAIKAIKDSGIIEVYASDAEMSTHDPIELWVEVVYKYYLENVLWS